MDFGSSDASSTETEAAVFTIPVFASCQKSPRRTMTSPISKPVELPNTQIKAAKTARAITDRPLWCLRHNTARPDIVGPDQPQAVDPLGVGDGFWVVGGVHAVSLWGENGSTAARGEGGCRSLGQRAAGFLKAEMKKADVTYADMVKRLKKHGLKETEAGITMKLKRGSFSAIFFLACVAALELEQVALEEI